MFFCALIHAYNSSSLFNTTKKLFQDSDVNIPVRAWYEQEGSFTNNEGKTQEFIDTIQDETNELKTIRMVFDELENAL